MARKPLSDTIGEVQSVWGRRKSKSPFEDPGKVPARVRCAHCSDFDEEGPIEEVNKIFMEHLAAAHPEVVPEPRRRKPGRDTR